MSNVISLAQFKAKKQQNQKPEALNLTAEEIFATAEQRNKMVNERLKKERMEANKKLVKELNNEK